MPVVTSPYYTPDGRLQGAFVYMLLCQDQGDVYVKVGISESLMERFQTLNHGCPVTPRQFAYFRVRSRDRARKIEANLHYAFRKWLQHGEWFCIPVEEKE